MKNKTLITIGKWSLLIVLVLGNFMSYMINETRLNIILVIAVLFYGAYEFLRALTGKNLNLHFKLYLFFFYMLSNISLLLGLRALLSDKFQLAITSFLFFIGDIFLILYMIHRSTRKE